jgi:hypothetical protein
MSSYQQVLGSRLGSLPSWGFLNPGSYMATSQPFPSGAFANWKPPGVAAMEGIQAGTQLGTNIVSEEDKRKLNQQQMVLNAATADETAARIQQIKAQTMMTANQMRGTYGQLAGAPLNIPDTPDYGAQALKAAGIKTPVVQQGQSQQPQSQQPQTGQQPQTTTTNPQQATTTTGDTDAYSTTLGGGAKVGAAGAGATPPVNGPEAATATAISAMRQNAVNNYIKNNPGTSPDDAAKALNSQYGTPASNNDKFPVAGPIDHDKLPTPNSDGRYFVREVNGNPLYYDPTRQDTYFYEPTTGGKEIRYYSRAPFSQWQTGIEEEDPQGAQINAQNAFLTKMQFDPMKLFPKSDWTPEQQQSGVVNLNNMTSTQRQIAMDVLHHQEAEKPLDTETSNDLLQRISLLDSGNRVLQSLNAMRDPKTGQLDPQQYNLFQQGLSRMKDKWGSLPVAGDVMKGLLGGNAPDPRLVNLLANYNAFAERVRGETTGTMRAMPPELKAMFESVGDPELTNQSFAQRFGNAMNQARLNFVDRVDSFPSQGIRLYNLDTRSGQILGVHKALQYADSLRPIIHDYVNQTRQQVPVSASGQVQPTPTAGAQPQPQAQPNPSAQATPASTPQTVEIAGKSRQEIANLPPNTSFTFNGKPANRDRIMSWVNQKQGQ